MLLIPNYISSKTYYTNSQPYSLSFVEDLNKSVEFIFKDKLSELWDYIVKTQDYDLIREYALKIKMSDILNDFLFQLNDKGLIKTDLKFSSDRRDWLFKGIKFGSENYSYYSKSKNSFLLKNKFVYTLHLILTYKCNLTCKHCCNPKNVVYPDISFEQAKKIIDDASDIGCSEINLTGGECVLNKDFLKIANYVKSKYLKLIIFTNGQNLYDDENLFNSIVELHPYSVQISLYSMNPDVHDNMTGVKGSHNKTISIIKKLKELNISVSILNFQSVYNKGSHKELKKFAESINVGYLDSCLFIDNPDNNNHSAALSEDEMIQYFMDRYSDYMDLSSKYKKFYRENDRICKAGYSIICVEPDLNVTPCMYSNYSLGNLHNTSLKEIKEKVLPEFQNKYTTYNLTECFKYDYCEYCSYCLMTASQGNKFLKKDETLCKYAKALKKAFDNYKCNKC